MRVPALDRGHKVVLGCAQVIADVHKASHGSRGAWVGHCAQRYHFTPFRVCIRVGLPASPAPRSRQSVAGSRRYTYRNTKEEWRGFLHLSDSDCHPAVRCQRYHENHTLCPVKSTTLLLLLHHHHHHHHRLFYALVASPRGRVARCLGGRPQVLQAGLAARPSRCGHGCDEATDLGLDVRHPRLWRGGDDKLTAASGAFKCVRGKTRGHIHTQTFTDIL